MIDRLNVIIAGSRNTKDLTYNKFKEKLDDIITYLLLKYSIYKDKLTIVSGCAKGIDSWAITYSDEKLFSTILCPAEWERYGKSAGYIRNEKMGNIGNILVAFWNGKSSGTKHMIDTMTKLGKEIIVIDIGDSNG